MPVSEGAMEKLWSVTSIAFVNGLHVIFRFRHHHLSF